MSFIEEFHQLEQAVSDFDSRPVNLTDIQMLSDADLDALETSRLPLYRLHEQAYKERLRRCEIQIEVQRKEQERLKARYGYRYPEKDKLLSGILGEAPFVSLTEVI